MTYTITLADGRKVEGLVKNGNNYVSSEYIDESIFEGNMSPMDISDGETTEHYDNGRLVQQIQLDGMWFLLFSAMSDPEPEPQSSLDERVAALERGSEDMTSAMNTILEVYEND